MTIKFKETKIHISFFFGLTVALIGLFDKTGTVFLCLLSGVLHETGHLTVLLLSREKPREIHITPFGMRIERKDENFLSFKKEILCAFAGPFINIVLFLIFKDTYFSKINLSIAALNLLPCEPLDGSKILENLLNLKLSKSKAEKISFIISCITVFPVSVLGLMILIQSKYNFSLLLISFYLVFFIIMKKKKVL